MYFGARFKKIRQKRKRTERESETKREKERDWGRGLNEQSSLGSIVLLFIPET